MAYTSMVDEVCADMLKAEKKAIKKACEYLVVSIKDKIDSSGIKEHTHNLKRGVSFSQKGNVALVGFGPPAYHAHLLEFGTKIRKTKSGKVTGQIKPTPIISAVMNEEAEEVSNIISEEVGYIINAGTSIKAKG